MSKRSVISAMLVASGGLVMAACDGDSASGDTDATATTTATTGSGDGGSGSDPSEFCDALRAIDEADDDTLPVGDPAELETSVDRTAETLRQAGNAAPETVADDVETMSEAWRAFADELADVDYDALELPARALVAVDSDEVNDASDRLDAYGESECEIPATDDDGVDSEFADMVHELPRDATVRDAMVQRYIDSGVAERSARCLGDRLTPEIWAGNDKAQLNELAADCGVEQPDDSVED